MVGAEDAFAVGEVLPVEVGGLPVLSEVVQRECEVVAAGEGLGVVGAEDAFGVGEDLPVEVGGLPGAVRGCAA